WVRAGRRVQARRAGESGDEAIRGSKEGGGDAVMERPTTFEDALDCILAEMRAVMIERQLKYGSENILDCGKAGIAVRMSDKAARLRNAWLNGRGTGATDESIEDTLIDAANYAVIGLMLGRGWWGLPMEAEEP